MRVKGQHDNEGEIKPIYLCLNVSHDYLIEVGKIYPHASNLTDLVNQVGPNLENRI